MQTVKLDAAKFDFAKAKGIVLIAIVVVVIVLLIVFGKDIGKFIQNLFGGIKDVTDTLGLTTPQQVTDAAKQNVDNNNPAVLNGSPFSPSYWEQPGAGDVDTGDGGGVSANDNAAALYACNSDFSFNGQTALSIFQYNKSKAQVSFMCYCFETQFGNNCWDWMSSEMKSNQNIIILSQIVNYANSLPASI